MNKKTKGKRLSGRFLLLSAVIFITVFYPAAGPLTAASHQIELIEVIHEPCISPNGDGQKDSLIFTAHLTGKPGKKVYAFLFIREMPEKDEIDDPFLQFLAVETQFSSTGEVIVTMEWDGRDWPGSILPDDNYQLQFYCVNFPFLFNSKGLKPKDVYEKLLHAVNNLKDNQVFVNWSGQVTVDTAPPVLAIDTPPDQLETTDAAIDTSGSTDSTGAGESLTLTINDQIVPIDDNLFSSTLSLDMGENPFTYILEDCAGNQAVQEITVSRIEETPPVVTFQAFPQTIQSGESAELTWTSENARTVTIDNGIGTVELNGSLTVSPGHTTTYTITAEGPGGIATAQTTIEVIVDEQHFTAVYGRVFEAESNTPLADAVISAAGNQTCSNSDGYWKLVYNSGGLFKITITKQGYTSVYRKILLLTGEEGVVDSAYLTPHDTLTTPIGPEGGTHTNSDGTVEVVIPPGALDEVTDIRVTRLSGSNALPGDLNETDNLDYPIGFLFCADLGPNDTQLNAPVTLRVQNTWGFQPGTEIPYACWNESNQKWVPVNGMAKVDAAGQWLEASVKHFSFYDVNMPLSFGGGFPMFVFEPFPDDDECEVGSRVNVTTGSMRNSFSVPGVNSRIGNTGLELVYSSKTAYPTEIIRVRSYYNYNLVDKPDSTGMNVSSALATHTGGTGGSAGMRANMSLNFSPSPLGGGSYGMGAMVMNARYPSGRKVGTGFHKMGLKVTNFYPGEYYLSDKWGGMPTTPTGIPSIEPAYFQEKREERVFMVSHEESPFGRGWYLEGLKRLHFDGGRVVVINADGTHRTYEQGINFADARYGAVIDSHNYNMINEESMLLPLVVQDGQQLSYSQFHEIPSSQGTDQTFIVDLGQERYIEEIGLEFPPYWDALNVWDYVDISTSLDKTDWELWYRYGIPTLSHPAGDDVDALDNKIRSPIMVPGASRLVRYIRCRLGFPSSNSAHNGSGIYRVYAIGDETQFRNSDEEKWPMLEYDTANFCYVLTEYSGEKRVFDQQGRMIESKDRQGRAVTYQYLSGSDRLGKIIYPGNAYMEFQYDGNGFLSSIRDSSGRQTQIITDAAGHVKEVVFPDDTRREFAYDNRGLMTMDKNGNAVKTYTWHAEWPVLTNVLLPNGGMRTVNPAALKYLINPLAENAGTINQVDFPYTGKDDGMDSEVTFEDGLKGTYRVGRGWKSRTMNNKLKETIYYANKRTNRVPVKVEEGIDASDITDIKYTADLQVERIRGKYKDTAWIGGSGSNNTPWTKAGYQEFINTVSQDIFYNDQGLVSKVTGPHTNMSYTYDANGNLVEAKNINLGKSTKYGYDTDNNLVSVEYADGKTDHMVYDATGLLTEVINNDNTKVTIARNTRGEIESITDEENRTVTLERDIMGRITKETSPSGRIVIYEWGGTGCGSCGSGSNVQLTKIVDPGNNIWEFKYDIMGNAIEMIYPDGSKIKRAFNTAGKMKIFTNKRNQSIHYSYDADGRMVKKSLPEGDVLLGYDDKDRVTSIQAADFHYNYQYGSAGGSYGNSLVHVEDSNTGLWSQHVYNRYGLPIEYYDSFQWKKSYTYNFTQAGGTPIGFTPYIVSYHKFYSQSGQYKTVYTYDQGLRLYRKRNDYLKTERRFFYDSNGILSQMNHRNVSGYSGFPEVNLYLNRDDSSIITSITGDKELNAFYNPDLEITGVHHTLPTIFDESYTYDTRGNRLSSLTNTYTYNDLNQMEVSDTQSYQYDADGNLVEEKDPVTGETRKYYYDSENRLTGYEHYPALTSPADITATYTYDIFGRRLQKNVNGVVTNFFWEDDNLAYELDAAYQPIRRYVYGAGKDDVEGYVEFSEVDGFVFDQSKKGWYTYIKDQVGTVYKVYSDYSKQIVDTHTYDTFGNLISQTGISNGNLGFQSKYYDQESGLYYFLNRYYASDIGRFANEDYIGFSGSDNFYCFVENNPVNNIDPFGLAAFKNNCNRSIPYKPEETSGDCDATKKYYCPPGATCDVDGVYPPDGGNPIKICDGCEAECNDGKLIVTCSSIISRLCQRFIGGPKSDRWMKEHKDWPRPEEPTLPPCSKKK